MVASRDKAQEVALSLLARDSPCAVAALVRKNAVLDHGGERAGKKIYVAASLW